MQTLFKDWGSYTSNSFAYNEILNPTGEIRPHWHTVVKNIEELGPLELQQRIKAIRELLSQEGVTYNVYEAKPEASNILPLDPIPFILSDLEWKQIEQGVTQRANLLNQLLKDIYQERKLVKERIIPPELLFSHPGFLLPCQQTISGDHALMFYAVDLIRSPDGAFKVIGDRTQNPSGIGYALENRMVLSRVLPTLFKDFHIHRLTTFFRVFRQTLRNLSSHSEEPLVVVLTPGDASETYFEHMFLANYFGYPLVEANDLVVNDQQVWFRAMDGLQRVDVIVRRVDDNYCDPLELRGDSLLGVPGLLQCVRANTVTVVNPLGSGILESPAWLPYLPHLCQYYLGEELRLPSVTTHWCGDSKSQQHIFHHLNDYVIKRVYADHRNHFVFGDKLNRNEQETLIAAIQSDPYAYVAQEKEILSTQPFVNDGGIEPRHIGLRSFLVYQDKGYCVMPGGLTRVSPQKDSLVISSQQGGFSKDTWVVTQEPSFNMISLPGTPVRVRGIHSIPRKLAENLFWSGRYTKRTEMMLRLLRQIEWIRQNMEFPFAEVDWEFSEKSRCLDILLNVLTHTTVTYPGFLKSATRENIDQELVELFHNRHTPGTVRYNLTALRKAVISAHRQLPGELSNILKNLDEILSGTDKYPSVAEMNQMVIYLAAFRGICVDSIDYGWIFWDIGRRLEWALNIVVALWAVVAHEDIPDDFWQILIVLDDNQVIFHNRYLGTPKPQNVIEMILRDVSSPHSVITQLHVIQEHLAQLQKNNPKITLENETSLVLELLTRLRIVNLSFANSQQDQTSFGSLNRFLLELGTLLRNLSDSLHEDYLTQSENPQQI